MVILPGLFEGKTHQIHTGLLHHLHSFLDFGNDFSGTLCVLNEQITIFWMKFIFNKEFHLLVTGRKLLADDSDRRDLVHDYPILHNNIIRYPVTAWADRAYLTRAKVRNVYFMNKPKVQKINIFQNYPDVQSDTPTKKSLNKSPYRHSVADF